MTSKIRKISFVQFKKICKFNLSLSQTGLCANLDTSKCTEGKCPIFKQLPETESIKN